MLKRLVALIVLSAVMAAGVTADAAQTKPWFKPQKDRAVKEGPYGD